MAVRNSNAPLALGFLTVVQHEQHGLFGGYLLLNPNARPLEFHCTAPVKPNRAQEILYGPTLEPYLYGEQIGRTLLQKAKVEPLVVWTDLPAVLAVREHVSVPVAVVLGDETEPAAADNDHENFRVDAAHKAGAHGGPGPHLRSFQLGNRNLAVAATHSADCETIRQKLGELADHLDLQRFDLLEPFERIRAAIEEAQRASR